MLSPAPATHSRKERKEREGRGREIRMTVTVCVLGGDGWVEGGRLWLWLQNRVRLEARGRQHPAVRLELP